MANEIVVESDDSPATPPTPAPRGPSAFQGLLFAAGFVGGLVGFIANIALAEAAAMGFLVGGIALGTLLSTMIRVANQWEKALVFRLGRYVGTRGPGMFAIIPIMDSVRFVDTRIQTLRVPHRQAITKDNVPVNIDGVIFMRVNDPSAAVIRVQDYLSAVQQYAQTALRDIVGGATLDQVLADREELGHRIQKMVESEIDGWGLDVAAIRIQDIELPEDLKRVMARQASAEREKRATITKAEGDREAADNLAAAAEKMNAHPGAMHLRTLQTLDALGTSSSNTVVLALPIEVTDALRTVPQLAGALMEAKKPSPQ